MGNRVAGKVAWVTGGASGMGEAACGLLAEEGAAVAVIDVQEKLGKEVARRIKKRGGEAVFIPCDVTKETRVKASIRRTVQEFGGLDIIVNCAGVVHVGLLHDYTEKEWDLLMNINVKSIFFSVKHGVAHLRKAGRGYVVNIGSIGSFITQAGTPAYTASKGAVLQLSRSIAVDYAADGVRCNCICPGITDTPMLRYHMSKAPDPAAALAARLKRVPMGVPLTPRDIAKSVLYFSCEDSAGVTGTSLVIDCGYTAAAEWEVRGETAFQEKS